MSDLGPVTFGQKDEFVFLGRELHEARTYSESTASRIDEQISKLIATARTKAAEILEKYNEKLELIAQTLISNETIEQKEFVSLMTGIPVDQPRESNMSLGMPPSGAPKPSPAAA